MRRLMVFNQISLDGYFVDGNGDMSWAKSDRDPEFDAFVEQNASGEAELLFGRLTYELMASYWPTPLAIENDPVVADRMNTLPKVVFSKTLDKAPWQNTKLEKGVLLSTVRKLKEESGPDIVIFGSGSLVSQLARAGLIDEYQFVMIPVALGKGRTMFDGIPDRLNFKLTKSRAFGNGSVFLSYEPILSVATRA
ncbi:MAG TPA: dihydrofolate reductase family protein [Anaerolineales bacterium]